MKKLIIATHLQRDSGEMTIDVNMFDLHSQEAVSHVMHKLEYFVEDMGNSDLTLVFGDSENGDTISGVDEAQMKQVEKFITQIQDGDAGIEIEETEESFYNHVQVLIKVVEVL